MQAEDEMLDDAAVADLICGAIGAVTAGHKACFALSGGQDSTLLTALAKTHGVCRPVVAYTVDTQSGRDLHFSKLAAEALGIDLKIIELPEGEAFLEMYQRLSTAAGEGLLFVGYSIAFAAICEQARKDGFDMIVDGNGSTQLVAGLPRHDAHFVRFARREGREDLTDALASRRSQGDMHRLERMKLPDYSSFGEMLVADLQEAGFVRWTQHHAMTTRATGVSIAMPFMHRSLDILRHQPLDFYYPDGWDKSVFRRILLPLVGEEVAYRKDNQGLRWRKRQHLSPYKASLRRFVIASGWLKQETLMNRLQFRTGLMSIGALSRMYQRATTYQLRQEG